VAASRRVGTSLVVAHDSAGVTPRDRDATLRVALQHEVSLVLVMPVSCGFTPACVSRQCTRTTSSGLIYPVRVCLDASDIMIDGMKVAIAPGMAVNAEIITGNRWVIDYVLSPVVSYRNEAARERLSMIIRHQVYLQRRPPQLDVGSLLEKSLKACAFSKAF
jgi:hypothetical protein